MVQDGKAIARPIDAMDARDQAARRAGYDAVQRAEAEKKQMLKSKQDNKYGAWGPVFKNRSNFNSMHFC